MVVKHVPTVLPDEENTIWESKTIGDHSSLAFQRAVFYYVLFLFFSSLMFFTSDVLSLGWLADFATLVATPSWKIYIMPE